MKKLSPPQIYNEASFYISTLGNCTVSDRLSLHRYHSLLYLLMLNLINSINRYYNYFPVGYDEFQGSRMSNQIKYFNFCTLQYVTRYVYFLSHVHNYTKKHSHETRTWKPSLFFLFKHNFMKAKNVIISRTWSLRVFHSVLFLYKFTSIPI